MYVAFLVLATVAAPLVLTFVRASLAGYLCGSQGKELQSGAFPSAGWHGFFLAAVGTAFLTLGLPLLLVIIWLLVTICLVGNRQARILVKRHAVTKRTDPPVRAPASTVEVASPQNPADVAAKCLKHPASQQAPDGTCWGCLLGRSSSPSKQSDEP